MYLLIGPRALLLTLVSPTQPSPVSQPGYFTLETLLAREGGLLLVDVLRNFHARQLAASAQDPSKATLAPKITKEIANIKWNHQSAREIERLNRAFGHQVRSLKLALVRLSQS